MMMMYLFTTVPHPHGHWQLQELLGNQCYHYHYLRLAYLEIWNLIYDIWYMMCDMIFDIWYLLYDVRYDGLHRHLLLSSVWYLVSSLIVYCHLLVHSSVPTSASFFKIEQNIFGYFDPDFLLGWWKYTIFRVTKPMFWLKRWHWSQPVLLFPNGVLTNILDA